MNIAIIAGTPPNPVKLPPIIKAMNKSDRHHEINYRLLRTSQYYDHAFYRCLFRDLEIPVPEIPGLLSKPIGKLYKTDKLSKQQGKSGEKTPLTYEREKQEKSMLHHIHTVANATQVGVVKASGNSDSP